MCVQVKNAYQTLQNEVKRDNIVKLIKGARKSVESQRAKLIAKGFVVVVKMIMFLTNETHPDFGVRTCPVVPDGGLNVFLVCS